jgi:hypothetical protein
LSDLSGGKALGAGGARREIVAWIRVSARDFVGFAFGSMRSVSG